MAIRRRKVALSGVKTKEKIKKIQMAVDRAKKENKEKHFTSLTPKEIEKKLKRVKSPMIYFQSWGSTTPGGSFNYNLGIYNPDPNQEIWMFAHVWVGSGNVDPVEGTFLNNVDTRFPRLTLPDFAGLTLAPGASTTLSFTINVPSTVETTNYLGNSCLMRFNWHDVGDYLDRSVFVFDVT